MKRPHRILLMSRPPVKIRPACIALALLFLLGAFGGHYAAEKVSPTHYRELSNYLQDYIAAHGVLHPAPIGGVLFAYFRGPLLFWLSGFSLCGIWLVPLLILGQGFLFAFSIRCFIVALGRAGLLCAFAAFGVRCLFVVPCSFFLAVQAWSWAEELRRRDPLRRGRRPIGEVLYPLCITGVILLIGCIAERFLVPRLFARIMG